jgi:hypothetical protein
MESSQTAHFLLCRDRFGMMLCTMQPIKSPQELKQWLEDKPVAWAQVIASRLALRTFFLAMARVNVFYARDLPLSVFRAAIISWSATSYPGLRMSFAAKAARKAAEIAANDASVGPEGAALTLSWGTAYVAAGAAGTVADPDKAAEIAAASTDNATAIADNAILWSNLNADCDWLVSHAKGNGAFSALTRRGLWWKPLPDAEIEHWEQHKQILLAIDPGYEVCIEWYERRINGERSAFDIPGDRHRGRDKWVLRQIARAKDEEFWDFGAKHVNRQIAYWLEEARARAAKNLELADYKPNGPILSENLQAAASPQAATSDGKLDAGPNSQFDQPTYSGDLADLPSAMRSFIKVLLNSLGENASAFMRSSLEGYHEELELRGTQPIVGTLKGLAQAISREIWTSQSLVASDDPDDWEMRDEREWGAGMGDLFRTFAKYSADLINHFPLDEEREELLRATPIDEMAASGDALTEPIALVTGLVRDLHAQGMATDNILRIMDAHAQYNRDIASLPPPPANLPDDYVTAKRRHVLMTAGFYLHLYSVLGSTASLAPAYSAMGTFVWNAAQALLAFVR